MAGAARRFKERILHTYFVRCDMSLILAVVVASGILSSKLLLECGLHSLPWRYPLALVVSFGSFLLLIRIWIWYVFCRKPLSVDFSNGDVGDIASGGGGDTGSVHFGGGDSGGGGASDNWADGAAPRPSASSGGGGSGFDLDLDLGDDWLLIALVVAVVLSIACAGGYLIYAAPNILPEAAWQATLAGGLARVAKPSGREDWLRCVVRASWVPFAVVLVFVIALGWVAHSHCPSAVKLMEALRCPA
jgi:hypothetical protein